MPTWKTWPGSTPTNARRSGRGSVAVITFRLFSSQEGGRSGYTGSGGTYRPHIVFERDDEGVYWGVLVHLIGAEEITPGAIGNALAIFPFVNETTIEPALCVPGAAFVIKEGAKSVGMGHVVQVRA